VNFVDDYRYRCSVDSDIVDHLPYLYDQAQGKQIIELGVRGGNSTAAFLAAIEDGGHLWSVDILDPQIPADWYKFDRWTFRLGDDLELAGSLPDAIDVVFIDTSHHYNHTMAELNAYTTKLVAGGVVLLHDTELERPYGAIGGPAFPVRQAIEDWTAVTGWEFELRPGCNGLGVVHKPRR
jgi:predicted O-methyltransferase YrrM